MPVLMEFYEQYSPESVTAMKHEVASIMRACSLNIQWRALDGSASRETYGRLVVTRFRGKCRGDVPQLQRRGPKTLGLTHVAEGEILPFSELDCDRVRNFVQPKRARKNRLRADQLLGRALGRVLAHELYHVLAKTAVHGLSGIATATLTAEELVGGQPRLHAGQSEGIRRSLLEAGLPAITASAAR